LVSLRLGKVGYLANRIEANLFEKDGGSF